ncbi:MAG: hypothetical protein WKF78_06445 [Candidatus Limnocylindrales bacterium]
MASSNLAIEAYCGRMYVPCRLCGGPSTIGDGAGAPCRRCIKVVVQAVAQQPSGESRSGLAVIVDQRLRASAEVRSQRVRGVAASDLVPVLDWSADLAEATLAERRFTGPAAGRLPIGLGEIVRLATLPAQVFERSVRTLTRHVRPQS